MNGTQDRILLVTGALTVTLVVFGLAVVEANTGPFEHDVQPAAVQADLAGEYTVREGSASTTCQVAEAACEPRTEIDVTIEGLPRLGGEASYGLFLAEGSRLHALGLLSRTEEALSLEASEAVDGDDYERLLLGLVEQRTPERLLFALDAAPLPTSGGETVALEASLAPAVGQAEGQVSLAQIGAVEVAVTADATVDGLPRAEDWTYEAWLVDEDAAEATWLGTLDPDRRRGEHGLDVRVARVTLADQETFLVTLEAPDTDAPTEPRGFPVASVPVDADSLFT